MTIEKTGTDCQVVVRAGTCERDWNLKRSAGYADGVLVLNRPVEVSVVFPYQKLYAIRLDGEDYLLPASCVASLQEILDEKDNDYRQELKYGALYVRTPKNEP